MVRWIWQNSLVHEFRRWWRLFLRWLLVWFSYLVRELRRRTRVLGRVISILVRPKTPDNLFTADMDPSDESREGSTGAASEPEATSQGALLWASQDGANKERLEASALSLWRGQRQTSVEDSAPGAGYANRRFSYIDLLAAQVKRLDPMQIDLLDELVQRLAKKWQDIDEQFEWQLRRNKLDVGRTLRHNIPRYAGKILNFQWATKERPVPQLAKPARILVIGDVSHSMVHYMSIVLFFFHRLNFRFTVDSYVFSERPTHSAPFLNGLGTFQEKVQRLVAGAKSWNAGTRFGTALEEIAKTAVVDEYTYVIIGTDGKVSLQGDESDKIHKYMTELRQKAKQVVFLTPSVEFSDGASGKRKASPVGSFRYGFYEIPIFEGGPPLWYGILGQYADRLYLVRSVQDLVAMSEDLILSARSSQVS